MQPASIPNQRKEIAAHFTRGRFDHGQRDGGRERGIDSVSALSKGCEPCLRCQVLAGRDDSLREEEWLPVGGHRSEGREVHLHAITSIRVWPPNDPKPGAQRTMGPPRTSLLGGPESRVPCALLPAPVRPGLPAAPLLRHR